VLTTQHQVTIAVNIKVTVLWSEVGYRRVHRHQHSGEPSYLHFRGRIRKEEPDSSDLKMEAADSCETLIFRKP
jgi:hypothetical protein